MPATVTVQDLSKDPYLPRPGWVVDIDNYEALGLTDTSSRYFIEEFTARTFAADLAALLIIEVEDQKKQPQSRVLTPDETALIVAYEKGRSDAIADSEAPS